MVEIVKVSVRLKTIKILLEEQCRVRGEDVGDYKIYIMKDYCRHESNNKSIWTLAGYCCLYDIINPVVP